MAPTVERRTLGDAGHGRRGHGVLPLARTTLYSLGVVVEGRRT